MKSKTLIEITLKDRVGQLMLTHTRKLNVMGNALVNQLIEGMAQLVSEGALSIIIKTLPGVKVWSAGYDINELPPHGQDPLECHEPLRRAVRAMQACPVPILMQIEGSVWGGACELVMNADLIIAAEGSVISFTPSRLGVPYNPSGIMSFLNCIPLHILKEMFYRAQQIPVERLAQYGVINYVVPATELAEFTHEVALDITKTAPLANAVFKEQVTSITNSIRDTRKYWCSVQCS